MAKRSRDQKRQLSLTDRILKSAIPGGTITSLSGPGPRYPSSHPGVNNPVLDKYLSKNSYVIKRENRAL